jgi:hypothetical protein
MKLVKQILFALIMVVGLSVASMAQKGGDDKKNPPPKEKPPVINPGKGNPQPRETPKPKKPGMAFFVWRDEVISNIA